MENVYVKFSRPIVLMNKQVYGFLVGTKHQDLKDIDDYVNYLLGIEQMKMEGHRIDYDYIFTKNKDRIYVNGAIAAKLFKDIRDKSNVTFTVHCISKPLKYKHWEIINEDLIISKRFFKKNEN